jgi:hypothetical protein
MLSAPSARPAIAAAACVAPTGPLPTPKIDQPRCRHAPVRRDLQPRREPRHRVVPRPPRGLLDRALHPCGRAGHLDRCEQFARPQRGFQRSREEVVCGDAPLALGRDQQQRRVERDDAGRQLGRGVRIGRAAADRAAVADRGMRDQRHRLGQERCLTGNKRVAAKLGMPGQCADAQHAVLYRDTAQLWRTRDVNQHLRL